MNSHQSNDSSAGFTLVEILAVVPLIGVFAALGLSTPILERFQAARVAGVTVLRQAGAASDAFASDHDIIASSTNIGLAVVPAAIVQQEESPLTHHAAPGAPSVRPGVASHRAVADSPVPTFDDRFVEAAHRAIEWGYLLLWVLLLPLLLFELSRRARQEAKRRAGRTKQTYGQPAPIHVE